MFDENDDEGFEELEDLNVEAESTIPEGPESVEDSIVAAFDELDTKAAEAKEAEPVEAKPEDDKPKSELSEAARKMANARKGKGPKQVVEATELDVPGKPAKIEAVKDSPVRPSDDWDVNLKQEFNALPKAIQQRSLDFYNGIKGNATKALQELNREKGRYAEINEIADHYAPRWGMKGQQINQVTRELFAAQEVIMQNPALAIATLIKKTQADYTKINAYLEGNEVPQTSQPQNQPQNNSQQPQQSFLTPESIREILRQERESERQQSEVSSAQAELETLKHSTSPDGRTYLYPELHSDEDRERLKPLVDSIRKTQPGITWTNATILAIQKDRFVPGTNYGSPSPNVSRLPNPEQIQRARQASVSPRGRGNATIASTKLPDTESVEDSMRAVWGGNNGNY